MKVIIAGAGIGGLTAALSLQKIGVDVRLFESVSSIRSLGVGINVLPHATRELFALGLQAELDSFAIKTRAMKYFTRRGKEVISVPCGEYAGYKWPQYSLHRGEFQMMLLNAFKQRAGADKVICGHAISEFEQDEKGVKATFIDSKTKEVLSTETADLLIAADGLHSVVRKQLYPNEGRPVFSKIICYRGAVESTPYLDGESMIICGDNRLRLVSYPISETQRRQGNSHINWIASVPFESDTVGREDWAQQSRPDKLLELYRDWQFDWLNVPQLIQSAKEMFEFPVYDRDPLKRWTFDRVTLLGDAAHPLIPVSSSGAVHAIIDGRALAYALGSHDNPLDGLIAYEQDRLPKANRVVVASRNNGPDEVLEIVRRECDDADNIFDYVDRNVFQKVIDDFKELSGFGIDTLNNLDSYEI
ncbi:MAG: flavin-dependent oxidoreductase [Gammaproteobacteria bacterium]|nr:flavin-dependent oxidoreductase [Gammaproteobacteria bacterium]